MIEHRHLWYVKGPNLWKCKHCPLIGYFRLGETGRRVWATADLRKLSGAAVTAERMAYLEAQGRGEVA